MNALLSRLFVRVLAVCLLAVPVARAQQEQQEGQQEEQAPAESMPLYSQAELDQMLAPIALYPDQLLSQLLMAATYPLEVVEAARWSRAHPDLKGEEAVREADGQTWDPSVKSMVAFPDILRRMDEDLEWTQNLGDAFLAQQEQVMDTVQALRARAEEAGNLQSNDRVEVVREEQVIIVRDRRPDIVYLPWYDPWRVYGAWWWPTYRPVYWDPWPGYYYGSGFYYWGPTIVIGHGFYYGDCDWHRHQVRVVPAPPFYYRRPPPVRNVWVHEYRHRRGVPYRGQEVHQRYAEKYARPPRLGHPPYTGKGPDGRDRPTGYRGDDTPRTPGAPGTVEPPRERPRTGPDGTPARPRDREPGAGSSGTPPQPGTPVTSEPRRPDSATPQRGGRHEDAPTPPRPQTGSQPVVTPREPSAPPRDVTPSQPRHESPSRPREQAPAQPRQESPTQPRQQMPSQPRYEPPSQPRYEVPTRPSTPRTETPRSTVPRSQPPERVEMPSSYQESRPAAAPRQPRQSSRPSPQPSYQPAPQPSYQPAPQPSYQPAPQPRYSPPQRNDAPARQPRNEPSRPSGVERESRQSRNEPRATRREQPREQPRQQRIAQRA